MKKIELNGKSYQVFIERKAIKNMYLRLIAENVLSVTCSFYVPDAQIEEFLISKTKWIEKTCLNIREKKQKEVKRLNVDSAMILGKEVPLIISEGKAERCVIKEDCVYIACKNMEKEHIESMFYQELTVMMMKLLKEQRFRWDRMLDDYHLSYPQIKVKKMTSRWGSCTPKKNLIVMNVMLMHYPQSCIDAVLLHEYVHLIVPNHSKRFYEIIEYHMPQYKEIHRLLK